MMISPSSYIRELKDADYLQLIGKRDELLRYINDFEKKEMAGDRSGEDWIIHPQPDVIYQEYLEYLSELCILMKDRYNSAYVWGDRTLHDDVENRSN